MNDISKQILRYSLAGMLFWFAWQQLMSPGDWLIFLPTWTGYLPIPAEMLIQANGWLEMVLALALLAGVFVRPISLILGLHLVTIAFEVSGAILVRDLTLAWSAVALAVSPADKWTLDCLYKKSQDKISV